MDDPKAQTLEALEEFIAAQRSLLARTQEDIERLRALKGDVVRDPEDFFENLGEKLDSPSFRLSDHRNAYDLAFTKQIQWGAFSGHDPTPLRTLPAPPTHPLSPLKTQRASLSPLQLLVKSAKQSIVDPVFVRFPPPFSLTDTDLADMGLSGLGSLPVNAETARRNREHEKIRELKKMVKFGGKGRGRGGGLSLPKQRQAVFVREDVEDESLVEVDMSMDVDGEDGDGVTTTPSSAATRVKSEWVEPESVDMDVDASEPPPAHTTATMQKGRGKAKTKTKPPPAPRTTARRSTARKDLSSLASTSTAIPAPSTSTPTASTMSSSRPSKRTKAKPSYEYTDDEDDDDYDDYAPSQSHVAHTPSTSASTSYAPPPLSSSSSTPPPHQHGGKSLAALSRVASGASTPSTSGKSLEAMGLGSADVSTTPAMVKKGTGKAINRKATAKGKTSGSANGKKEGKKEKPKPETYKQAWSVEEQHLLEQLLEEIPEGSGFRWQKISRAMGGRRTPRQVASRVQKYFEKLKRFGVG